MKKNEGDKLLGELMKEKIKLESEKDFKKVKKEDINIVKSENNYFLDIHNKEVDVYRVFKTIEELINHLNFYDIKFKEEVIKEIQKEYNYDMNY